MVSMFRSFFLFFIFHIFSFFAAAQVNTSAGTLSMAGAGRASVHVGDAHYLNPATLVHLLGRYLVYSTTNADNKMISLSDNTKDSHVPGALSYFKNKIIEGSTDISTEDISLALSGFIMDRLSIGITGHSFRYEKNQIAFLEVNADIGLLYTPTPSVGIALVSYNIFGEKSNIPSEFIKKNTFGIGFNYLQGAAIRYRIDYIPEHLQLGLESYLNQWLAFRVGVESITNEKYERPSFGLSFEGPRFGIAYAYQGNTKISADYTHKVDLILPF